MHLRSSVERVVFNLGIFAAILILVIIGMAFVAGGK